MNARPPIRWDDNGQPRRPGPKIMHAKHDEKREAIILNPDSFGVYIHWFADVRRNQPCTGQHCRCNSEPVNVSWRTYLGAWDVRGKKTCIVELPSQGWGDSGLLKVRQERGTLRGIGIELDRFPRVKTGRVTVRRL